MTFNTGLSGYDVYLGNETSRQYRRTAIINAIRVEDADIVCLQMVGKFIPGHFKISLSFSGSLEILNAKTPLINKFEDMSFFNTS